MRPSLEMLALCNQTLQLPLESLKPQDKKNTKTAKRKDASLEGVYWESVQRKDMIEEYQSYLDTYPDGTFADLAKT